MKLFKTTQEARLIPCLFAMMFAVSVPSAQAATYTWNSTNDVGTTDWNTAANWTPATIPGTATSDVAAFADPTGLNTTVNLSASVSITRLLFSLASSSGYAISSSPNQTITLNAVDTGAVGGSDSAIHTLNTSGTNTIDADIVFGAAADSAQAITVYRSGTTLVLNGTLSSSGALSYVGFYPNSATIVVTGTNTYGANSRFTGTTGQVWVNAIGNAGSPGNLGAGTAIEFTSPTTLRYLGPGETTTKGISFVNAAAGGAVVDGSGAGGLTIAGDVTATTAYAHTLTLKGDSAAILNEITGDITDGAGTVSVVISSGQWTLSGDNDFSGIANRVYQNSTLNINSATALGSGLWTVDSSATLENTSAGALTLASAPTFKVGSFTFKGTRDLNLGTGAVTVGTASTTILTVETNTLVIGGAIGQSAAGKALTKEGAGRLVLQGANTWSGTTTVNGGVLQLDSANALPGGIGASGGTSALTLGGGVVGLGSGDFLRAPGIGAELVRFYGDGGFAANGADRVVNLGGASEPMTWGVTANFLGTGKTLILGASSADATVDFQNPISLANAARTIRVDDGAATVDGRLSGVLSSSGVSGGLVKTGPGTLELTADNIYTGPTTIEAGCLLVNGTTTGQGDFVVNADATLGGTGAVGLASGKTATIEAGGTLAPGAADVGTLSVVGDVVLDSNAVYAWECDSGVGDLVTVGGDLRLPATATVDVTCLGGAMPKPAVLFSAGSLSGADGLSGWTVTPDYAVRISGTSVVLFENNPRTVIVVR